MVEEILSTKVRRGVAIDPGNKQSGYLEFAPDESRKFPLKIVSCGVFANPEIRAVFSEYDTKKDVLLVEMVQAFGMPISNEGIETCVEAGRMIQLWQGPWSFVSRQAVKLYLCHSVRAKDTNIRAAIIDRFGGEDMAIGKKKCFLCKGKGVVGRNRDKCTECTDGWELPPGPLAEVRSHIWPALALALYWVENPELKHALPSSLRKQHSISVNGNSVKPVKRRGRKSILLPETSKTK